MARVVAELGRPETAEETAARKAEFSRQYRTSKTFPSLIAAVLATMAILCVVVLGVPRGTPSERPTIDAGAEAAALETSLGRTVIDPAIPETWRVNSARIETTSVDAWTVVYVPDDDPGFLRIAQGFGAGETWPAEVLSGARSESTVTIDGLVWDEYSIADSAASENVSYALATQAGTDRILVYGSATPDAAKKAAAAATPGILELRERSS